MNKNFLQIRSDRVKQSRDGRAWLTGFSYVSLVTSKIIPFSTGSSLAMDFSGD